LKQVLLVMTDALRCQTVSALATEAGLEVLSTPSGLHALTQLERNPPDVIVCDQGLSDLSAEEFHEIIRSEPGTRAAPLLLLGGPRPRWLDPQHDTHVPGSHTSREVVVLLQEATNRNHNDPFRLQALDRSPGAVQMRGTLEVVNLFDLVVSFNQMNRTGQLVVNIGDIEALIFILAGELQHVEYSSASGQMALMLAFADSSVAPASSFVFSVMADELLHRLPKTIEITTSRMLLEIAVHLDHVGQPN
jgi:Domain of unknown function (DUF4388)